MTRGNRPAYTLVEMMVVVAIIIFIATIGMVNYLNFQDRQRLENTAKELIVWLRGIQQKARVGDRGEDNPCNVGVGNADTIARGEMKLDRWQVQVIPDPTDQTIKTKIACHNGPQVPVGDDAFNGLLYTSGANYKMPQHISLEAYTHDPNPTPRSPQFFLAFDAVYGQIYSLNSEEQNMDPKLKNSNPIHRFVLSDGVFSYVFLLENGAFSSGCFCNRLGGSSTETCLDIKC